MAISIEKIDSREWTAGQAPQIILRFFVDGTTSDTMAYALIFAAAPAFYQNLYKQSIHMTPGEGPTRWYGDVTYGPRPQGEPGEYEWQIEVGGGTIKKTYSLSTIGKYAKAGETATNHRGAINVSKDGDAEGVDVEERSLEWSETHYFAAASFNLSYIATLYSLKAKVNNALFRGFAAGEVLFRGASASPKGIDTVTVTFKFAASPNLTGIVIGDITPFDAKGWEYVWVQYEEVADADGHTKATRPKFAYVEQVYASGNFNLLGIPSIWS